MSSAVIHGTRNQTDETPVSTDVNPMLLDDRPMMTRPTPAEELARLVRERVGGRGRLAAVALGTVAVFGVVFLMALLAVLARFVG